MAWVLESNRHFSVSRYHSLSWCTRCFGLFGHTNFNELHHLLQVPFDFSDRYLCDRVYQAQSDTSRQVYQNLIGSGHIPHHDETELSSVLAATTSRQPHLIFDLFVHHNPAIEDDFSPLKDAGYKLCTNSTENVVQAVHQCGGVALIAHPGRTDGFATFDMDLLDEFCAEISIDGIEVYYPRHTPEQVELYQAYAGQRGWLISAGSDSHAPDEPPIKYQAHQCAALLARLDIAVL